MSAIVSQYWTLHAQYDCVLLYSVFFLRATQIPEYPSTFPFLDLMSFRFIIVFDFLLSFCLFLWECFFPFYFFHLYFLYYISYSYIHIVHYFLIIISVTYQQYLLQLLLLCRVNGYIYIYGIMQENIIVTIDCLQNKTEKKWTE